MEKTTKLDVAYEEQSRKKNERQLRRRRRVSRGSGIGKSRK